jgi:hypothetical protein
MTPGTRVRLKTNPDDTGVVIRSVGTIVDPDEVLVRWDFPDAMTHIQRDRLEIIPREDEDNE